MGEILVITTRFLTKNLFYDQAGATNAIAMN